jgi:hypothetical protein
VQRGGPQGPGKLACTLEEEAAAAAALLDQSASETLRPARAAAYGIFPPPADSDAASKAATVTQARTVAVHGPRLRWSASILSLSTSEELAAA